MKTHTCNSLQSFYLALVILLTILTFSLSTTRDAKTDYDYHILKEGISTQYQTDGPIPHFSFQEKDQIKIPLETDGYIQHMTRKTEDNRRCAKAFVFEKKTYFDCTKARSPDGNISDKEWCFVDGLSSSQETRNWNYCVPIMDFDRIRLANFKALMELTKLTTKINTDISQNLGPSQKASDDLKKVKHLQEALENKINALLKTVASINDNLTKLFATKAQCDVTGYKSKCSKFYN